MKKLIALLMLAPAILCQAQAQAQAQGGPPTKAEMDRAFAAQRFVNTLIKAAVPAGKTGSGMLSFIRDQHQWQCTVDVKANANTVSVTENDALPERACVQAILQLSRQHAL